MGFFFNHAQQRDMAKVWQRCKITYRFECDVIKIQRKNVLHVIECTLYPALLLPTYDEIDRIDLV